MRGVWLRVPLSAQLALDRHTHDSIASGIYRMPFTRSAITHHFGRCFDIALNAITLIVGLFLLTMLATHYFFAPPPKKGPLSVGSVMPLSGINWSANKNTLVIALQIHCPYCKASMGFYRNLLSSSHPDMLHVTALFPEPVHEAMAYLHSNSLNISDVRQEKFDQLQIAGTPTLLLVNQYGAITASWFGQLSPEKQKEVWKLPPFISDSQRSAFTKAVNDCADLSANTLSLLKQKSTLILDVRPRSAFKDEHLAMALNIPYDELESRAAHELSLSRGPLVLYCATQSACPNIPASVVTSGYCKSSEYILRTLGFQHLLPLAVGMSDLENAGVATVHGSS
jgi:hypothetical protein